MWWCLAVEEWTLARRMEGKRQSFRFCDWCLDIISSRSCIRPPRQCYQDIRGLFLVTPSTHCTRQQTDRLNLALGHAMHCGRRLYLVIRKIFLCQKIFVTLWVFKLQKWFLHQNGVCRIVLSNLKSMEKNLNEQPFALSSLEYFGCQKCVDLV